MGKEVPETVTDIMVGHHLPPYKKTLPPPLGASIRNLGH